MAAWKIVRWAAVTLGLLALAGVWTLIFWFIWNLFTGGFLGEPPSSPGYSPPPEPSILWISIGVLSYLYIAAQLVGDWLSRD